VPEELKRYDVSVPGCRERFEEWVKTRGGIAVWTNHDLSDPGAGNVYTPALTDGKLTLAPCWRCGRNPAEVVTDLSRFRFAKGEREVDRFKVAVRMGAQGMKVKLTDASSAKLRKRLEKHGPDAGYRFDYENQQAVVTVPEWEK